MRTMCFIDGENLVLRYQDMVKEGLRPNLTSLKHIPDIFVWHDHLRGDHRDVIRVNYYTSAVGSEEAIDLIRDEISKHVIMGAGFGRRIYAHVFKKLRDSKKSKLVDISITIDSLRHVYGDHADTFFLFSGDGDFVPLVKEILRNGKQVVVGALSSGLNQEMRRIGDQFIDLDQWFFLPK